MKIWFQVLQFIRVHPRQVGYAVGGGLLLSGFKGGDFLHTDVPRIDADV